MDIGIERIYSKSFSEKGMSDVIKWEVQPIVDQQLIKIKFINKGSLHRQGIWLRTDKGIEIPALNEEIYPSINLWEDTSPKEIICKCHSKNGYLSLYNIWDEGDGRESQSYSSGMIVEEKDGIFIYYCNDFGFETNFDDLVFSIEKL
ncbi:MULTISPECIES: hypothetical protein [Bacillaceae]|uniref:DUF4178 domain-containing protein n=1 Tax=Gottfriedia luciferensis TaxID=178774 RepID=A0ABX2ZNG0_9BACI|nr:MULTISPECIES: hypothetical protein [Bacillaceae]ODG90029.1 hypothetical protein BED47_14285 [Gottfriedia luciferensis]PGZ91345.1 hypothetical protein COE53_15390 [Bacillus sp. AFS029533]SFD11485.1 hypothetical protein SAMN02799633_02698 [Bacillus sp. UNCCL81]